MLIRVQRSKQAEKKKKKIAADKKAEVLLHNELQPVTFPVLLLPSPILSRTLKKIVLEQAREVKREERGRTGEKQKEKAGRWL